LAASSARAGAAPAHNEPVDRSARQLSSQALFWNVMKEMIGDFFLRIGAMKRPQVEEVLRLQKAGDARLFGVIAIEQGYVNESAVKRYLDTHED
jgi:hypothetical protein